MLLAWSSFPGIISFYVLKRPTSLLLSRSRQRLDDYTKCTRIVKLFNGVHIYVYRTTYSCRYHYLPQFALTVIWCAWFHSIASLRYANEPTASSHITMVPCDKKNVMLFNRTLFISMNIMVVLSISWIHNRILWQYSNLAYYD